MQSLLRTALVAALALAGSLSAKDQAQGQKAQPLDAKAACALLGPGVNYGNVLEADPPEGWGLKLNPADFKVVAEAGFKSLRLPVRWNAKAAQASPYTIDPAFLAKVDTAVDAALAAGLTVIVDFHHYEELFKEPSKHRERFLGIWEQVAKHYASRDSRVYFEIMNEPHDKLDAGLWNRYLAEALKVIRQSNPQRMVIVGTAGWGGLDALKDLVLPAEDKNLIVTFHYYDPFHFTHQGAAWVGEQSKQWVGTKWNGSLPELNEIKAAFDKARKYSQRWGRPIYLGEFGSYSAADRESRLRWTRAVVAQAKASGFSHAYWSLKEGGFGFLNAETLKIDAELKDAILGN